MKAMRKYIILLILALELFFLYFQITSWNNYWVGSILFLLFILLTGYLWSKIFGKLFWKERQVLPSLILGSFISFTLLSLCSSIFVIYYKLSPSLIWLDYVIITVTTLLVYWFAVSTKVRNKLIVKDSVIKIKSLSKSRFMVIILYLILWSVGLYLLASSTGSGILFSPWQTIGQYYLPIFFILTLLLGIILFSRFKTGGILFIIILHSFLLHSYLPLSHQMPWGGDVWRNIAVEGQIIDGGAILPVLFGEEARWREFLGADLPEVFLIPHKYSYGTLWGSSVLVSETLSIDLITTNKWLVPILWSIAFPILLFLIGRILFDSRRIGLWLSGLSFIVFPFQALGSLSLANSLGFLIFLLSLLLWLRYLQTGVKQQKWLVIGLSLLMVFGYSLYFILIWIFILSSWIIKHVSRITHHISRLSAYVILIFASIFIIPFVELISKISFVPTDYNLIINVKQLIGQFSGWYFASAIRPHDILSGNILFNHTPDYAFVSSLFTDWRWYIIPLTILIWITALYGLTKVRDIIWQSLGFLFTTVLGGYIIGWFVLEGDRLFTRRLDAILALLLLIFFIFGIKKISNISSNSADRQYSISNIFKKSLVLILIFILSWFATTTYASGPDMRVMSTDEYRSAQYVWENIDKSQENFCVLADTWVLLSLEGISAGEIVGGGFPIDYQFGQPERVVLLSEMMREPRASIFEVAHKKTGADRCWVVLPGKHELIEGLIEDDLVELGDLIVWQEGLKKSE
ncbi:hypothetical protein KJ641_03385 [Patescibacteria group bacterium]|nr:hypothetical protein [Patescibacteria group bacterium]MBU1895886.1 hypothetical protein [Patescibacteria group bacterium]